MITIWKTKDKKRPYRNLHISKCSWWVSSPINIKAHNYWNGHFGFEFMPVGFNKYNKGWNFRVLNLKLVWVG